MSKPDAGCTNCNGKGWVPAFIDIHGDGKHACFCVTYDQGPKEVEEMNLEELQTELRCWRRGELYRGYDRIKALKLDRLKANRLDAMAADFLPVKPTREQS